MTNEEKEHLFLELNSALVHFWKENGRPPKELQIELLERILHWYKKMGYATMDSSSKKQNNHEECVPEIKETCTQGLDEAAKAYATEDAGWNPDGTEKYQIIDEEVDAFKAGAEWMKEQYHFFNEAWADDMQYQLDRNYENGKQAMKEQMLKEAVEGEVCGRVYDHINVRFADGICKFLEPKNISHIPADVSKYKVGDKVRIIVCKNED